MQLHHGDCLEVLRGMADACADSIVTDPPYGLSFMGKRWDYDVPSEAIWRECLRVLKPGGHLLAFAGTRTQHRMAVRIEDAGFEIRDMIAWVYGSGFPKSRNLDGEWQGWGTALKPALEPITVARKPLVGTVAANVLAHGTGAINVNGCRVPTDDSLNGGAYAKEGGRTESQSLHGGGGMNVAGATTGREFVQPTGRWPANLINDGSDEVLAAFPGEGDGSAARFFYCAKASRTDRDQGLDGFAAGHTDNQNKLHGSVQYRNICKACNRVHKNSVRECCGAPTVRESSERETRRNVHPTVKPTDLMRYLCRLVTPPGGVVLDPFMGSGSTGKAAVMEGFRFIGCELSDDYVEIARARILAAMPQTAPIPSNDNDQVVLFRDAS
jgi:DNA modification methylase